MMAEKKSYNQNLTDKMRVGDLWGAVSHVTPAPGYRETEEYVCHRNFLTLSLKASFRL